MKHKKNYRIIRVLFGLVLLALIIALVSIGVMKLIDINNNTKTAQSSTQSSDSKETEIKELQDSVQLKTSNTTASETSMTPNQVIPKEETTKAEIIKEEITKEVVSKDVHSEVKKPLQGYIIGIDPGHQTKGNSSLEKNAPNSNQMKSKASSGTQGRYTYVPEYKLNLEVGLLLKEELINLGAKVVMTREINDIDISNIERAMVTNDANCDMVIRLHADGSDSKAANGYSVLVPGEKYTKAIVPQSRKFAEMLDDTLKNNIIIKSDGIVTRDDLTGFNWSKTPVILLEMGFMTNKRDDEIMQTEKFKKDVVFSIGQALQSFFKQGKG